MVSMRGREREATSRDRAPRSFRVIESKDLASQNVVMVLIKFIIDITMKKKRKKEKFPFVQLNSGRRIFMRISKFLVYETILKIG